MSYAVGDHFEKFIREQVEAGRYNNASEVVREGLRLVEEREAKLQALRNHITAANKRSPQQADGVFRGISIRTSSNGNPVASYGE